MSDKLFDAANHYFKEMEGKTFLLKAGKKGEILNLKIYFGAEHFKHLIGLQKLQDRPSVLRKSEIVYKEILDSKITFDKIKSSKYLHLMEDRLNCFEKIKEVLFNSKIMSKSKHGEYKSIKADFLLLKKDEQEGNIHLFLSNTKNGITIPCTFFTRQDEKYLKDTIKWTVLNVSEISKEEKQQTQPQISQSKSLKFSFQVEIEPIKLKR